MQQFQFAYILSATMGKPVAWNLRTVFFCLKMICQGHLIGEKIFANHIANDSLVSRKKLITQ